MRFYRAQPQGPPTRRGDPAWLGAPIPAHTLVLAATSPRFDSFDAQIRNRGYWGRSSSSVKKRRFLSFLRFIFLGKARNAASTPLLSSAERPEPSSSASGGNTPLMLAVPLDGPHELQAATHVLEYMYTEQLPTAASPLDLVQMHKQAQYLLCVPCAAACAATANAAAVTPKDALEVYAEPGALQDSALSPLIEKCWAAAVGQLHPGGSGPDDAGVLRLLLSRLGSTLEVMRSPELQKLWLALPIRAVQMLLSRDTPMVMDCEESVLLLLHRWVSHAAERAQHGKQLRSLLSPLDLCPAYLRHVLPKLGWLGLGSQESSDLLCLGHSNSLDESLRMREDVRAAIASHMPILSAEPQWHGRRAPADISTCTPGAPKPGGTGSCSGARTGSSGSSGPSRDQLRTVAMQLEVERSVLQKELSELQSTLSAKSTAPGSQSVSRSVQGSRVYCAGYEWHLELHLSAHVAAPASAGGPAPAWTVKGGLFVHCNVPSELRSLGVVTYALARSGKMGAAGHDGRQLGAYCFTTGRSLGAAAYFMEAGALRVSAWKRYLRDGGVLLVNVELCIMIHVMTWHAAVVVVVAVVVVTFTVCARRPPPASTSSGLRRSLLIILLRARSHALSATNNPLAVLYCFCILHR